MYTEVKCKNVLCMKEINVFNSIQMCLNLQEIWFCVNTVRNYSETKVIGYEQRGVALQNALDSVNNDRCCDTKVMWNLPFISAVYTNIATSFLYQNLHLYGAYSIKNRLYCVTGYYFKQYHFSVCSLRQLDFKTVMFIL